MTHSTKNAIELKCKGSPMVHSSVHYFYHDACVAAALMKAKTNVLAVFDDPIVRAAFKAYEVNAAEILESEYGIKP